MRAKSTQSVSRAAVLVGLVLGLAAFDSFAVRAVLPRRLPVRPPSIDVKHFNRPFRSPSIALDALAAPSRVVDVSPKSPSRASSRVLASAPLSRVVRTVAVVLVRLVVRGVVGRLRHRSTLARLRCALDKDGSRVSMRARRPDGMGRENPNLGL